jgi:hypothetical protein
MEVRQQQQKHEEGEIVKIITENDKDSNNDISPSPLDIGTIGRFKKALMAKYPVPQTDQDIQVRYL